MRGIRCQRTEHNSIMSCVCCVIQRCWRKVTSKPMEQVRKSVYDKIFDKYNLLEETGVLYENEIRYVDNRSFECFNTFIF